jgi:prevent-host-death family protein
MEQINVDEAKTHLSRLLDRVEAGEEFVICWSGKPVARLVSYERTSRPRQPGAWRGKVRIADDFDELPEEIMAAFRGEGTCSYQR